MAEVDLETVEVLEPAAVAWAAELDLPEAVTRQTVST